MPVALPPTEMRAELRAFFAGAADWLTGDGALATCLASFGASEDALNGWQFYRRLMRTNALRVLSQIFSGTRDYLVRHEGLDFAALAAAYTSCHVTAHWDLNEHARAFAGWLREEGYAVAAEAADFEWCEFLAGAAQDPPVQAAYNTTLQLSLQANAVHEYVRAARRGEAPAPPAEGAFLIAVFREPRSQRVVWLHLDTAQAALLAASMEGPGSEAERNVSTPESSGARARLVAEGLLF